MSESDGDISDLLKPEVDSEPSFKNRIKDFGGNIVEGIRAFIRKYWKELIALLLILAATAAVGLTVFFAPLVTAACLAAFSAIFASTCSTLAIAALAATIALFAATIFFIITGIAYKLANRFVRHFELNELLGNPVFYMVLFALSCAMGISAACATLFLPVVGTFFVGLGITIAAPVVAFLAITTLACMVTVIPCLAFKVISAMDEEIHPTEIRIYDTEAVNDAAVNKRDEQHHDKAVFSFSLLCCCRERKHSGDQETFAAQDAVKKSV